MTQKAQGKTDFEKVVEIIQEAGGMVVGRTRLQKLCFFLEKAGLGKGFSFEYRHYGPYSEDLSEAARLAHFMDLIEEKEEPTSWGGYYSTYTLRSEENRTAAANELAVQASHADSIQLELAATALFIAMEEKNHKKPWEETERRKPEKAAHGRLEKAKELYRALQKIKTPQRLPDIA